MNVNLNDDLLTQENVDALTALCADVPQDVTEWNNDVFASVKDVVVEPFITQANDSIAHSKVLMDRIINVLATYTKIDQCPGKQEGNINLDGIKNDIDTAKGLLETCKTAYGHLNTIGLKIVEAVTAGKIDYTLAKDLLHQILDLGNSYNATVQRLCDAYSEYENVRAERSQLDGIVGNEQIVTETPGGRKDQIDDQIINKAAENIEPKCKEIVQEPNQSSINSTDIDTMIQSLDGIQQEARACGKQLDEICQTLTEYDTGQDGAPTRRAKEIDVKAMQQTISNCDVSRNSLLERLNAWHENLQAIDNGDDENKPANLADGVDKYKATLAEINVLNSKILSTLNVLKYSPLRTQNHLEYFNENGQSDVMRVNGQAHTFVLGSLDQLGAFAGTPEIFSSDTRVIDCQLLQMFEVLLLTSIARCQRLLASNGLEVVQDQIQMIERAKWYVKTLHDQAVASLGSGDLFVVESNDMLKNIHEQYDKLQAQKNAPMQPVEGGMDVDGVKNLFAQYRRLQDVSGKNNNCFFNSVILQTGGTLDDQDNPGLVNPLREVARINEEGGGWMANEECLQKVATYLQRPMVLLSDQNRDNHQSLRITLACPLDANRLQQIRRGEFDLSITEDHLINNSTVLNILTGRMDAEFPVEYNDQAVRIARALGVWNEDQKTMVANLQNMTVRDALVRLLQNQEVIALYLKGGVVSLGNGQSSYGGHYQSYVMK